MAVTARLWPLLACLVLLAACVTVDSPSAAPVATPDGGASPTPILSISSPLTTVSQLPTQSPDPTIVDCSIPLQSLVNATPSGGTLDVPPCLYRETVVIGRPLTLHGDPGAEIRGSDVWSSWTAVGGKWVSTQTVPQFDSHGSCQPGTERCLWPEQVFLDGAPLLQDATGTSPASGEFALDGQRHVVLGDDPSGRLVEVTVRQHWIVPEANGITIDGLRMQHAADDAQDGAINDGGFEVWIRNCVLSDAHGGVVSLVGSGGITDSEIFRGGQLGIHMGGSLVSGDRIHDNNTEDFDPGWEAGGLKSVNGGMLIDGNEVYDNNGPGLWLDLDASNSTISNNRVHDNAGQGIFYEISDHGTISNNVVWQNSRMRATTWVNGAGIFISSSGTTEVSHNIVAWNGDGIAVVSQNRPSAPGDAFTGIYVHDNSIIQEDTPESWGLAWAQDWNGPLFDPASNNQGANDTYWFTGQEGVNFRFAWNGSIYSLAQFNATPGEENGTYMSTADKNALLTNAGVPVDPPASPLPQ